MKIQETNILFLIVCDKQKTVIFQNNSTQTKHITNLFVVFFKRNYDYKEVQRAIVRLHGFGLVSKVKCNKLTNKKCITISWIELFYQFFCNKGDQLQSAFAQGK